MADPSKTTRRSPAFLALAQGVPQGRPHLARRRPGSSSWARRPPPRRPPRAAGSEGAVVVSIATPFRRPWNSEQLHSLSREITWPQVRSSRPISCFVDSSSTFRGGGDESFRLSGDPPHDSALIPHSHGISQTNQVDSCAVLCTLCRSGSGKKVAVLGQEWRRRGPARRAWVSHLILLTRHGTKDI